jgi:putative FmdB family regulatory protein
MPTYEYRCASGHEFEKMQRMSEDPIRECPICGSPAERLLSAGGGLVFKGSGFYITDYARSDSYKKSAAAEGGSSGEGASSPSKEAKESKDSKPADGGTGGTAPAAPSTPKTD